MTNIHVSCNLWILRCLSQLNTFNDFMNALPLRERQCVLFQQDGCHSQLNVREYIGHMFNGTLMDKYSDIFWPAKCPDLNFLDYFLWCYWKQKFTGVLRFKILIIWRGWFWKLARKFHQLWHYGKICWGIGGMSESQFAW